MKKIIALLILMLATAALVPVEAQNVNINININLDKQPAWGPVGYRYVDYYYFPDINVYYDVNYGMFYYTSRGRWISARYLPPKYSRYDLYGMYKVVLNERDPWVYNKVHKKNYAQYRGNRTQVAIRHTTDSQYRRSRSNDVPWVEQRSTGRTSTSRTSSASGSRSSSSSVSTGSSSRSSNTQSSTSSSRSSRSSNSRSSGTSSNSNSSSRSNSNSSSGRSGR